MDAPDQERMPGDTEAAAAIAALSDLGGWAVGDQLWFRAERLGVTKLTAARVQSVLSSGRLLVQAVHSPGAWIIEPSDVSRI